MNKLDKAFSNFCKKQGVKHPGQFADDVRPAFDAGYVAGKMCKLDPPEDSRQAFEAWVQFEIAHRGYSYPETVRERNSLGDYAVTWVDSAWMGWQARQVRLDEATALMQEFCDRVDKGEVRSTRTYAKFKQFLEGGQ